MYKFSLKRKHGTECNGGVLVYSFLDRFIHILQKQTFLPLNVIIDINSDPRSIPSLFSIQSSEKMLESLQISASLTN